MEVEKDWGMMGIGIVMVTWCLCYYLYKKMKMIMRSKKKTMMQRKGGVIPKGSLGWPLIGETLDFIASNSTSQPVSFMTKRTSLYGKVFKTHILGTPIIVSTDPDVNKAVLQNNGNTFIPAYPKSIRELLGDLSILQTNGSLHRRLHTLIAAFLRSPNFKSWITKDIQTSVINNLASWAHTHHSNILVQEQAKKITFEVLVKVLMSIEPGEELEFLKREFEEFIKGLICLPIKLPGTTLYKSLKAKARLLKKVKKIVEDRKTQNSTKGNRVKVTDVVDLLLGDSTSESNENQSLPLDLISSNIIEMMIPGEETVPTAMTLAVEFLGDCPVALNRMAEENMELKRKKTDAREDYSWADYMSLPFTQNVINETLRLANIINGIWRQALKDIEIKGNLIPQGWCVLASLISVHMDDENYTNPYKFDPWRWEETGGAATKSNCFTPFGGGQRLCPGLELSRLEIAIFLHHLVTTYRWVAEEDEIVHFPTVKMKKKLPITVSPLNP